VYVFACVWVCARAICAYASKGAKDFVNIYKSKAQSLKESKPLIGHNMATSAGKNSIRKWLFLGLPQLRGKGLEGILRESFFFLITERGVMKDSAYTAQKQLLSSARAIEKERKRSVFSSA
jgi:hypothetical protein